MTLGIPVLVAALLAAAAAAGSTSVPPLSPYAGEEARELKALSAAEVAGLLAGEGLGHAKAAELNGYPGPSHVLALAEQLGLSPAQRRETQALFERMRTEARRLGAELVAAERELDRQFAERTIAPGSLAELTARIGAIEARLRAAHLSAHLEQAALLDAEQVHRYNVLRGYTGDGQRHPHGHHGHHGHGRQGSPVETHP